MRWMPYLILLALALPGLLILVWALTQGGSN
jgi:hypothetical protein